MNWVRRHKGYFAMVILPTVLFAAYLVFFASKIYESNASFTVRQNAASPTPPAQQNLLSQGSPSPSNEDALVLQQFITSKDMLSHLEANVKLREHYESDDYDWFSRLGAGASFETLYAYFLGDSISLYGSASSHAYHPGIVAVTADPDSAIVNVAVRAYTPEFAQQVLRIVVQRCQAYVNQISRDMALGQLAFLQEEVERAGVQMRTAAAKLKALQDQYDVLDPDVEIQAQNQIIAGLETNLAAQKAELKRLESFLTEKSPDVINQIERIKASEAQIRQERAKQAGSGQNMLNTLSLKYQEAQMAAKFTADLYQSTLSAQESARQMTLRDLKFLAIVSAPNLPDRAAYPRRLYALLTAFVVLNLIYGITTLMLATVLDHRD